LEEGTDAVELDLQSPEQLRSPLQISVTAGALELDGEILEVACSEMR
jgi:hypothetical protein